MKKPRSRGFFAGAAGAAGFACVWNMSFALAQTAVPLEQVVISASRTEQTRFDAPAAIDVVQVDPFHANSALVNLSELLSAVPGLQVRERQNYAQDLQVSVRGFGTRATFGVRGVRILVDGIPATMPDGQGQAASASLTAASRIEVLRGPMAQLYGNAAGGVVQIFAKDPAPGPRPPEAMLGIGAGSDGQRQMSASIDAGSELVGAMLDISRYSTDGYRDHSAAERTELAAKVVLHASRDSTVRAVFNVFDQPVAQDPLGLTRADFDANPRQVVPGALLFNTRKSIAQKQIGLLLEQRATDDDTINARVYAGTRQVNQALALTGSAATSSGGIVDLDRDYGGAGVSWHHKTRLAGLPMTWIVGVEADRLRELRRGFVNNTGLAGDLRRDESDSATDLDLFGQFDWTFAPQWRVTAGARASRVRLAVDDHYITAASPNDSGAVLYRHTSPVAGLVWRATDDVNLYANLGGGFETPSLAEAAYKAVGTGPNLSLRPSTSVQGELGAKIKSGRQRIELALFDARSTDEIVASSVANGRAIFQNVDGAERRGAEASWQALWDRWTTRAAYTWLDASFREPFSNASNASVAAGKRLPGAPQHSLFGELVYQPSAALSAALEMRTESKVYVNDVNSEAAPGYALVNARAGYAFGAGAVKLYLFARVDNIEGKRYAGSVIVNDANKRFYEAAAGRRLFIGLRAAL